MTFEQFASAHAGQEFNTYADFTAEIARAGLSEADRQAAYAQWRRGWGRAVSGGGELVQRQTGKIKEWSKG